MASLERMDNACIRVLGPVGIGNTKNARHVERIVGAATHAVEATAGFLVFPDDPWSIAYASDAPFDAPTAYLEACLAEAVAAPHDSRLRTSADPVVAKYAHWIAFATVVGTRSCVFVVFGDTTFAPSADRRFVVQTLLDNLAELSEAQRTSGMPRNFAMSDRLRLLEAVVVNANDAILITEAEPIDEPGPRILYANDAFARSTGYSIEELIGRSPRILQGADSNRETLDRLRAALVAQVPIDVEIRNYRKDGTPFWVELQLIPVPDERGRFTHWISVQRDITERHLAAESASRAREAEEQRAALEAEIRERGRVEERLAHSAYHDELTGLPNRALFTLRLEAALAGHATQDDGFSLLFMDLDRFKFVNDSLGHRIGDLLLIDVAGRLRKCLRDGDVLARMGGDEFTMLVNGPLSTAVMVAERVLQVLDGQFAIDGHTISTSPSIGIAHASSSEHVPSDLLRDADTAMYRAKLERGGSCYEVFDATMHATAVTRLQRELDLRGALDAGQFSVEYQPIVDIATNAVVGAEALVRWYHPTEGLLMPGHFVPLAEATGDIVALGSFVFERACRDLAERNARGCTPIQIGINVSSRELGNPEAYLAHVEKMLRVTGVNPACIQLEITEGILLSRFSQTRVLLERIRALGCSVAFDDFGTGYSNLGHLVRYPIDTLKIDRSFIVGIGETGVQRDLVRTIVSLAESLDLNVVAEGIETRDQAHVLRRLGCTRQQGRLYGPPVPPSELDGLIAAIRSGLDGLLARGAASYSTGA
jgi:diguanylate cyclase (GGDEF)-like protein/PAS domain S-box-containing protein